MLVRVRRWTKARYTDEAFTVPLQARRVGLRSVCSRSSLFSRLSREHDISDEAAVRAAPLVYIRPSGAVTLIHWRPAFSSAIHSPEPAYGSNFENGSGIALISLLASATRFFCFEATGALFAPVVSGAGAAIARRYTSSGRNSGYSMVPA